MKWFKSRKQKKIEELQSEIARLTEKENDILHQMEERLKSIDRQFSKIECPQYTIKTAVTETLVARLQVPRGIPMVTDDIEARLASMLAEQVAKYMIVHHCFKDDPLGDDVYKAIVKVVPYPVDENRLYE